VFALLAATVATLVADPVKSKVQFVVQHVFVERVVGTVPIRSATITLEPGSPIPASVTAELDASKVATGEPDRDASLTSADFFDVRRFPTWTFVSTKITPRGAGAFGMDGTLTVHGVSAPEHLDVTVRGDPANPTYHAVGKLARRDFKMAVTRLDPVIGTSIELTLDVVCKPGG
jgi:polyisoprenoid-binding protein YceI